MPSITIQICNAFGKNPKIVNVGIDTGYDGNLVIPSKMYYELNLEIAEIPKDESSYGMTATGERIDFKSSYGLISIEDLVKDMEIEIDSYISCPFPLIGRLFLSSYWTLIKGPAESTKVEKK